MGTSRLITRTQTLRWSIGFALLAVSLLIAACSTDSEEAEAEMIDCESQAFVDSVQVIQREGDYYAIVKGNYPDACTKTTSTQQKADGDTVTITLCTTQPEGLACAQMLTPFEEEVLLDIGNLDSGTYSLDVNGSTATLAVD